MKKWNIAAYLRLYSDDGDKSESNSISNQRNIIKQYIKNNNLNVNANYYIDDGYSGTTFERPDFKKMLKDMGIYEGDIDYIVSIIGNNFSSITDLQELLRTNSSRLDKHISVVSRYIVSRLVS